MTTEQRAALARANEAVREQKWRYHISDSQLVTLCAACGWQGGTYWQVVDEIRRLKAVGVQMLAVMQELQESASYWSEYDVPIGIVERINAAIVKATGETP